LIWHGPIGLGEVRNGLVGSSSDQQRGENADDNESRVDGRTGWCGVNNSDWCFHDFWGQAASESCGGEGGDSSGCCKDVGHTHLNFPNFWFAI
jgi:hypothetical protein